jgi:excinuclease ABC subunit A
VACTPSETTPGPGFERLDLLAPLTPSAFQDAVGSWRARAEALGKRSGKKVVPAFHVPETLAEAVKRYRADILEVQIRGSSGTRSVAEVLELTVHEALSFFSSDYEITTRLQPLADVGLDYLRLGQPVPTLSGGEAQRLKLAGFLAEAASKGLDKARGKRGTLFLFDEPTTGLHFHDVAQLLLVLQRLRDEGNTVVVIEHNLDVIQTADWIIDLGPEGGHGGGRLVAAGTPEHVAQQAGSHTGRYLAERLGKT